VTTTKGVKGLLMLQLLMELYLSAMEC